MSSSRPGRLLSIIVQAPRGHSTSPTPAPPPTPQRSGASGKACARRIREVCPSADATCGVSRTHADAPTQHAVVAARLTGLSDSALWFAGRSLRSRKVGAETLNGLTTTARCLPLAARLGGKIFEEFAVSSRSRLARLAARKKAIRSSALVAASTLILKQASAVAVLTDPRPLRAGEPRVDERRLSTRRAIGGKANESPRTRTGVFTRRRLLLLDALTK